MQNSFEDVAEVAAFLQTRHWNRICMDGVDGSGKSRIARELAAVLDLPVIKPEDFCSRDHGGTVDFIDYDAFRAALDAAANWIVEGVCLREVMRRAQRDADAYVYVKRLSHGLWTDEPDCVFPDGLEAALAHHRLDMLRLSKYLGAPDNGPVDPSVARTSNRAVELMAYHHEYSPHESADVVFVRNLDVG